MDTADRNERTEAKQLGQHHHISGVNTWLEILRVSSGAHDCAARVQCNGRWRLCIEWMFLIGRLTLEPSPPKQRSRRHGCTARTSCAPASWVRAIDRAS